MSYRDRKEYMKAWRQAHKEDEKSRAKAYYQAHRDEIKAYNRAHKEENKAYHKAWRQSHKDELKDYQKAWLQAHKEEVKAYKKAYYQAHKNEVKAYQKAYQKAWMQAHKDYMKSYKKSDTNSLGKTKSSVRGMSNCYLFKTLKHTKVEGYEIHHCFGYEDYKKFIYIPKELHLQIHQFLRDNDIDADSNHYNQIEHIIVNYLKLKERHVLVLR